MKKNLHNKKGGFTLIELLVVIAIIGILSSVVLVSLGTARGKAKDASVKAQMGNMRAQMELYSSNNGSSGYASGCTAAGGVGNLIAGVVSVGAVASVAANTTLTTAGGAAKVTCHENGTSWAADASLSDGATAWCVDSSGKSEQASGFLAASVVACTP